MPGDKSGAGILLEYDVNNIFTVKIINSKFSNISIEGNNSLPRSGAFEITKNNNLVYSKFQTGSFPTESEIISWFN